ncbi:unnamed protein product [Nippostrongylus brasiliensis]|uniref:CLK4-associating serine/arginine rich protein (inferred by orthology to a human protein) n=1 Tax=Nippostrongylus brasiliensis TaxID=27835 RepID=A0A0N4XUS2_NIPBR|nr:unnamed protein product [Nippostrongylus brasiliensis]
MLFKVSKCLDLGTICRWRTVWTGPCSMEASPAMSQLKQLVLGEDSPPSSPADASKAPFKEEPVNLIFEDKELEKTPLGDAIDSLMVRWAQLLSNVSSRPPVPAPSTIDHVKEVVEISMYHFRDSCLDVCSEFTKIDLQWQLDHPEEVYEDELKGLDESLIRQETLLARAHVMWHEARRQEKQLRARIVDCSKRAEKRRRFYDSVRKDPDQFMQLHGRKCTIHTDKNIAKAAEDNNILRKWQGDPAVLIDRFDIRSHLDFIPPVKKKSLEPDSEDEKQELICDFERYRVLIINEFHDVSEKEYLRKIAEKEFWRIPKDDMKSEHEKKKKSAESKASIGFNYENSIVVRKESEDPNLSDDDTDIEQPEDIDVELDLRGADAEQQRRVNCIGEAYGVRRGSFANLLKADAVARAETAELRRIDREKAALAGRDSKHERLLLKKQRALIVGKGCPDEATVSLLSFVEKAAAKKRAILESSSSSESEEETKPQFITTFGGEDRRDDDDDEEKAPKASVLGPQLPTKEYRRLLSSMSESEKERIEIENRKRRINRTKRMVRENRNTGSKEAHVDSDEEEKKEIARKIKLKMKKALRQTVEELKEEEEEKRKEMEKERRIRDEILYVEEMERRERERERRRERRKLEDSMRGEERDKRRRHSRSRSRDRRRDDRFSRKNRDYR